MKQSIGLYGNLKLQQKKNTSWATMAPTTDSNRQAPTEIQFIQDFIDKHNMCKFSSTVIYLRFCI